jgi:hypothetical protein
MLMSLTAQSEVQILMLMSLTAQSEVQISMLMSLTAQSDVSSDPKETEFCMHDADEFTTKSFTISASRHTYQRSHKGV